MWTNPRHTTSGRTTLPGGLRRAGFVEVSLPKTTASTYPMLRNSVFGPEISFPGRISAGFQSEKFQNRPPGQPKAHFEAFPIRIRPKSCPEARFPARKHYCVTGYTGAESTQQSRPSQFAIPRRVGSEGSPIRDRTDSLRHRGHARCEQASSLCYAMVFPGRKSGSRPAEGRPESRFRSFPDQNPAEIRPGSSISCPEALFP